MFRGRYLLFVLFGLLAGFKAQATHIVGAEFTYVCIDPVNHIYQFRLDLYQDCLTGQRDAIAQDNPARFKVFDGNGISISSRSVNWSSQIDVPPNFNNICVRNPPPTCLKQATFIFNETLPANASGYIIAYQRCCRNASITNVVDPAEKGATYFCIVPPTATAPANNGASFRNYPPQIVCINNPLYYDHSATDRDGDSLSYEFCDAYNGATASNPAPEPSPPPYSVLPYAANYSSQQPMVGNPFIQINPTTGIISGTPNVLGRFVVTVCCTEWRNRVAINIVKREFQFVVTNCSKAVVANIPQFSNEFNTYIVQCDGFKVDFVNISTGGESYNWDFGVPNTNTDVSTEFQPSFIYPDTGTYIVKLAVNRGSTCPDSISRIVKVYPTFRTEFVTEGLQCPNTPISFFDSTQSTYRPINYWRWDFGDGTFSSQQNPTHTYPQGGTYNLSLISRNSRGCMDTAARQFQIEDFRPFAGNDTVIVKGESIQYRARGGSQYLWTPATNLSSGFISNPVGYYPDVANYAYNVYIRSEFGCEGNDSIRVRVVGQPSLFVPSGFSPNGDGLNDFVKPITVGYRSINYFSIYNRWGQQVYFTTQFEVGWNGVFKGVPADVGVYYWVIGVTNRFGQEEQIKGDVTLLR